MVGAYLAAHTGRVGREPTTFLEVARYLACRSAIGVRDPARGRGLETGVSDREDQPCAWAQNARSATQGQRQDSDVHQGQVAHYAVEGCTRERMQTLGVVKDICDIQVLALIVQASKLQHAQGDVHPND